MFTDDLLTIAFYYFIMINFLSDTPQVHVFEATVGNSYLVVKYDDATDLSAREMASKNLNP